MDVNYVNHVKIEVRAAGLIPLYFSMPPRCKMHKLMRRYRQEMKEQYQMELDFHFYFKGGPLSGVATPSSLQMEPLALVAAHVVLPSAAVAAPAAAAPVAAAPAPRREWSALVADSRAWGDDIRDYKRRR